MRCGQRISAGSDSKRSRGNSFSKRVAINGSTLTASSVYIQYAQF